MTAQPRSSGNRPDKKRKDSPIRFPQTAMGFAIIVITGLLAAYLFFF